MKSKPISPALHGIIDYVFSAALFAVPRIIDINYKATRFYTINSFNTALYSAVTNYRFGITPVIDVKTHRAIDLANLSILALSTLNKYIHKDKRALAFTAIMAAAGVLTVLLTDWDGEE